MTRIFICGDRSIGLPLFLRFAAFRRWYQGVPIGRSVRFNPAQGVDACGDELSGCGQESNGNLGMGGGSPFSTRVSEGVSGFPRIQMSEQRYRDSAAQYWSPQIDFGIRVLCFSLIYFPLCASALKAAEGESEKLPLDRLIAELAVVWKSIHNIAVTTNYEKKQMAFLPVAAPVQMKLVMHAVVDSMGNSRSDTEGEQVSIEPDHGEFEIF